MKVAIVGLSPTSHDLAPWGDPSWEKWGLGLDQNIYQLDRVFEIHDQRMLSEYPDWEQYRERLSHCPFVYVQYETDQLPNGRAYPLNEVEQTTTNYLCSSIAYMLALAIHEGAEEIGVWGVDMKAYEEYGYQRPNVEYLIGLAHGRGIKVHVAEQSPVLKFQSDPDKEYAGRYGWLG